MSVCVHVYVSSQTLTDVETTGSSVPTLHEDPRHEPVWGSPVSNPASTNITTNAEFVSLNTELQVCVNFPSLLIVCLSFFLPTFGQKLVVLRL